MENRDGVEKVSLGELRAQIDLNGDRNSALGMAHQQLETLRKEWRRIAIFAGAIACLFCVLSAFTPMLWNEIFHWRTLMQSLLGMVAVALFGVFVASFRRVLLLQRAMTEASMVMAQNEYAMKCAIEVLRRGPNI